MERIDGLNEWLGDLAGKHPVDWDLLPDIGLYMDQVQTFIERQLRLRSEERRVGKECITAWSAYN